MVKKGIVHFGIKAGTKFGTDISVLVNFRTGGAGKNAPWWPPSLIRVWPPRLDPEINVLPIILIILKEMNAAERPAILESDIASM